MPKAFEVTSYGLHVDMTKCREEINEDQYYQTPMFGLVDEIKDIEDAETCRARCEQNINVCNCWNYHKSTQICSTGYCSDITEYSISTAYQSGYCTLIKAGDRVRRSDGSFGLVTELDSNAIRVQWDMDTEWTRVGGDIYKVDSNTIIHRTVGR